MSRFYIDELKRSVRTEVEDEWTDEADEREAQWAVERQKYSFDGRDTWALNTTMTEMLYERLKMYMVKADNFVNLNYYTFEFEGKTLTQREMILAMIEEAEHYLKFEYADGIDDEDYYETSEGTIEFSEEALEKSIEQERKAQEAHGRLWKRWSMVVHNMWW